MKQVLGIFAVFYCAFVIWTGTAEARPANVQAGQVGSGSSAVVTLTWQFAAGDRLFRTFNGDNWTEVTIPSPDSDRLVNVSDNNGGAGFAKGSNVFYEVRDSGYDADTTKRGTITKQSHIKRIDMFMDSGNPTADNAHGNYVSNTNACASCHVNHKGKSSAKQLLKVDSVRALCETCHTAAASGSKYLVDYGAVRGPHGEFTAAPAGPMTTGTEAVGSGFGSIVPTNPVLNDAGIKKATSAHPFTGTYVSPGDSLNLGLSADKKSTVLLPTRSMQCITCHQAHPTDNNYRLLKSVNNTYAAATVGANLTATLTPVVIEAYAVSADGGKEVTRYKAGATQYCEQCHKAFHPTTGTTSTFNGETFFIHPSEKSMNLHGAMLTSKLPLQNVTDLVYGDSPNNITLTNGKTSTSYITCITCHYSHGTPNNGATNSNFIPARVSSMLNRMENRGVCQECHKK